MKEDNTVHRVAPNDRVPLTLNYGGQYSETAPKSTWLKFRVVLPVQRCSDDKIAYFQPDILLVSDYKDVFFDK